MHKKTSKPAQPAITVTKASKYAVGDKVQLTETYKKSPASRFGLGAAHDADFKANAGVGTITRIAPRGGLAITWENGHGSALIHPRHVKRAR